MRFGNRIESLKARFATNSRRSSESESSAIDIRSFRSFGKISVRLECRFRRNRGRGVLRLVGGCRGSGIRFRGIRSVSRPRSRRCFAAIDGGRSVAFLRQAVALRHRREGKGASRLRGSLIAPGGIFWETRKGIGGRHFFVIADILDSRKAFIKM